MAWTAKYYIWPLGASLAFSYSDENNPSLILSSGYKEPVPWADNQI